MDWSYPLRAACERNPRRVALRYRGESVTFAQLESRIAATADGLTGVVAAGSTVAWMLANTPEAVEVSMALARVGAVSVPLNSRLTADELLFIVEDSQATMLLTDPEYRERADALVHRARSLRSLALVQELRAAGSGRESADVDDGALATLLYTSGTTGFPKGVMRTHQANAWNVVNSALGSPRRPEDVELFNLPAFGIGLLHFAIPALLGGATVVLDHSFDAARVWALLHGEAATRTFLAPTMISAMLKIPAHERFDLAALETIYTAYEFPEPLRSKALERFGNVFIYMYGLTEAQLTCARPGEFAAKPGSVGGAMGVMRVQIVDEQRRAVEPGGVGEIAMQGPATMSGYLNRPDETRAALRERWVMTGDLGRIDEDGDLYYVGRSKEMIKSGGFSIDPREVERALLTLPEIREAAVIGAPDTHWGEMVVAFVVSDAADVGEQHVIDTCRARLAAYKLPKRVVFLDALPLNATGKVERGRLRERLARAKD